MYVTGALDWTLSLLMCCNNNIHNGNTLLPDHTGCVYDPYPDVAKIISKPTNLSLSYDVSKVGWASVLLFLNKPLYVLQDCVPVDPNIIVGSVNRNEIPEQPALYIYIYILSSIVYSVYYHYVIHYCHDYSSVQLGQSWFLYAWLESEYWPPSSRIPHTSVNYTLVSTM